MLIPLKFKIIIIIKKARQGALRALRQGTIMSVIQMSMSDLLANLQDILHEEKVTKDDLVHPTPQRVQTLYFKFLLEFGFTDTMLRDTPELQGLGDSGFTSGSWDGHPSLYQTCQELDLLMEAIKYFFEKVGRGQEAFGLFDLIDPDAKRTRRFLAFMSNFWYFCNVNFHAVNAIKEEVVKKANMKSELHGEIQGLEHKIDSIRKSNAEAAMKVRSSIGIISYTLMMVVILE